MPRTVNTNALTPGDIFFIQGEVVYSHITKKVEGEELAKAIERAKKFNQRFPTTVPYTQVSIKNACVARVKNPNQMSSAEVYARESLYSSLDRDTNQTVWKYNGINKGKNLPRVFVKNAQGGYDEIVPEAEMDKGLKVTLVMRVFGTATGNNGVTMDTILVEEPYRAFDSSSIVSQLRAEGLILNEASFAERNQTMDIEPSPQTVEPYSPFTPEPVPAAQPQVAQAPVAPQAPVAGNPAPNPYADPFTVPGGAPQNGPGIMFNPQENNY